jgi:hypothetical protein
MAWWFIAIWLLVLGVAVFSKSMIANIALILACVLGFQLAVDMATADTIRWGVAAIFVCGIGFAGLQLVTKVDKF